MLAANSSIEDGRRMLWVLVSEPFASCPACLPRSIPSGQRELLVIIATGKGHYIPYLRKTWVGPRGAAFRFHADSRRRGWRVGATLTPVEIIRLPRASLGSGGIWFDRYVGQHRGPSLCIAASIQLLVRGLCRGGFPHCVRSRCASKCQKTHAYGHGGVRADPAPSGAPFHGVQTPGRPRLLSYALIYQSTDLVFRDPHLPPSRTSRRPPGFRLRISFIVIF